MMVGRAGKMREQGMRRGREVMDGEWEVIEGGGLIINCPLRIPILRYGVASTSPSEYAETHLGYMWYVGCFSRRDG